jgi:NAD(P)-dependent dehydrogenase (short-subunit alcohol dehydrogenase family)
VIYLSADYGRLSDVVRLAHEVIDVATHLDVLVNNAAIPGPALRTESDDGHELTLQVNYLAPVALTGLVAPALGPPDRPLRVVNVASATHLTAHLALEDLDLRAGYSPTAAYARSKLALVTYTCWLASRTGDDRVEAVSMHPGVISTALLHSMFGPGGDRPEAAARAIVEVAGRSGDAGAYYDRTRRTEPHPAAHDARVQRRLRSLTMQKLGAVQHLVDEGAAPP